MRPPRDVPDLGEVIPEVALGLCRFGERGLWRLARSEGVPQGAEGLVEFDFPAGDLLASGTVSGPDRASLGCLLEITRRGAAPVELPTGEVRRFLEDGDEVTLRGWCEREGLPRLGLGACVGRIVE